MRWLRNITIVMVLVSLGTPVDAQRSKKPPTFSNLQDTNQLSELNTTLSDLWNITNGRYTLENLTTDPNGLRKGEKGDLVYATFGGTDHLCINTSFPISTAWTCVNVSTLSTCPGDGNGSVQFNDSGTCGGEAPFIYNKLIDSVGLGSVTLPGATFDLDPADITQRDAETIAFRSGAQTITLNDGTTLATQRQNQFLAPTINGVSGGAAETVTDAATVFIDAPPSGSNISLVNQATLMFGKETTQQLKIQDSTSANTAGAYFSIEGADGVGTAAGGTIEIDPGVPGSTSGNAGDFVVTTQNGTGTGSGGDVFVNLGGSTGGRRGGIFEIVPTNISGVTQSTTVFDILGKNYTLADGQTLSSMYYTRFYPPFFKGVAGGGSEVVTTAATLSIVGPPTADANASIGTAASLLLEYGSNHLIKLEDEADTAFGKGGSLTIEAGNAYTSGTGGSLYLKSGSGKGGSINGTTVVQPNASVTGILVEYTNFNATPSGNTISLSSGATIAQERYNIFTAPTINGIAGGSAETVTSGATVYISGPPSGTNVTFTNPANALWVGGRSLLEGPIQTVLTGNRCVQTDANGVLTVTNSPCVSDGTTVDTTGLTANVAATTLLSVPSTGAGLYRISSYTVETTAGSISSTLPNVQIVYTDPDANTSITIDATPILGIAGIGQTGALTANTVGTASAGVIVINVKASTTIQYQTVNYASNLAGMTYALHIILEKM